MLIVISKQATPEQIEAVVTEIENRGYVARPIPGRRSGIAIGILYNKGHVDASPFLCMPGVSDAIHVTKPYKLVSRECKSEDTIVQVGDIAIGNGNLVIMAGPCAIESEMQALTIARHVKASGAHIFRGGAFKPRTSPYSFQGLGKIGLEILAKVRETTGMPVVTEVMDEDTFDLVESYTDIIRDRHPEYAEFQSAQTGRTGVKTGSAEAGNGGDHRRMADGSRIHSGRRQFSGDFMRKEGSALLPTTAATRWICRPYRLFRSRATCP